MLELTGNEEKDKIKNYFFFLSLFAVQSCCKTFMILSLFHEKKFVKCDGLRD